MSDNKNYEIHEQVRKQLAYLKSLVDEENKRKERCLEWDIPYVPSRRKYEDICLYNEYKKEIECNGDKNLLVMARLNDTMYGVYPFARRYAGECYFVHRCENGGKILCTEDELNLI